LKYSLQKQRYLAKTTLTVSPKLGNGSLIYCFQTTCSKKLCTVRRSYVPNLMTFGL